MIIVNAGGKVVDVVVEHPFPMGNLKAILCWKNPKT